MIDKNTGDFIIRNTILNRQFSVGDLKKSDLVDCVLNIQSYSQYYHYYLKPQKIGEDFFIIVLHFENDLLYSITLCIAVNGQIPSWENWSMEREMKLKEQHDEWLKNIIGNPPYEYNWGSISSAYDPRSSSSSILINYKSPKIT